MIITAIKPQKRGERRLNVFLDGEFSLGLTSSVLEESGIFIGQELSPDEVQKLKNREEAQQAWERAQRFMATRPRSEREVADRLKRYGYGKQIIQQTLSRLRKAGLLDDHAFADYWKQNRMAFNPRSGRLLALELKQKGIRDELANEVAGSIDEEEEAFRAGSKKARSLPNDDFTVFRRKLAGFLQRRGFNYDVVVSTVNRIWQEKQSEGKNG